MNIFKEQKEEKNRTLAILEDMNKTIEELKQLEKALNEKADILNFNNRRLSEKVETLDIVRIGKYINSNEEVIQSQITKMENAVNSFKTRIEIHADKTISKYDQEACWLIYAPIIWFTVALVLISYFYFINVRHIQEKNDILANKINNVYWILAEDNKFWYDKNSQKLFIENYNWIKDYKQNLQKKNKK